MNPNIRFNETLCTYDVRDGSIMHDMGFRSEGTCQCPINEDIILTTHAILFREKTKEFEQQDKTKIHALNRHIINQIQNNVDRVQINDDLWDYVRIPYAYRDQYNIVQENTTYLKVDGFGNLVTHGTLIVCLKKKNYVNPPNVFDVMWKYSS